MGPHENRALVRALLVGGAGSGLLVLSYLVDGQVVSLALNIVALVLMALGILLFLKISKASEQDYREGK